jgi:hypothetical protein
VFPVRYELDFYILCARNSTIGLSLVTQNFVQSTFGSFENEILIYYCRFQTSDLCRILKIVCLDIINLS